MITMYLPAGDVDVERVSDGDTERRMKREEAGWDGMGWHKTNNDQPAAAIHREGGEGGSFIQ